MITWLRNLRRTIKIALCDHDWRVEHVRREPGEDYVICLQCAKCPLRREP